MREGSWVGLDVHARSVVAGVIDAGSGEVRSLRVSAGSEATVAWLKTLPAPVRVVYEAGPTGYGLARACTGAGISCVVAAPSRIRPAADRVKTDRRDAERLARLLRLGEVTPVRVPGPEEEAARDLVRAREDARGDLMRARHRLSKLLLRHGAVYDGTAWTRAHDAWLRKQRFPSGPLAIVFDECYGRMVDAKARRDALDVAIAELAASAAVRGCRGAACLSPRCLDADGVRVDRRARRLEPVPPRVARPVPRPHPERELKRGAAPSRRDHQDRQRTRTSAPGRGRLAPPAPLALERHAGTQTYRQVPRRTSPSGPQRPPAPRTLARARGPRQAPLDHRGRGRPRARRSLLGTRHDGIAKPATARRGERTGATTRGATRENTGSSPNRPRSTPETGTAPHLAYPVMRHQPAHMSRDTDVDDSRCALPAETRTPQNSGANTPARLTSRTPYECSGMSPDGTLQRVGACR